MSAGSPTSRRGACASSAIAARAHRRGLSAHPALLPLPRRLWRGRCPMPPGLRPASRRARASTRFRASACAWRCSSSCSPRHAVPTLAVMTEAGLLGPVLGGVPLLASLVEHDQARSGARARARSGPPARRARACFVVEDAERLRERLRLANAEHRAAALDGGRLVADLAGGRRGRRRARCSTGSARRIHRPRAAGLEPLAGRRRRRGLARARDAARSAGRRRHFRSRPPTSSRAASRKGRRSARRCARPRRPGSRRDFRSMRER